jgi:CO/xanthine dehydrogenase Mo-binding subunit
LGFVDNSPHPTNQDKTNFNPPMHRFKTLVHMEIIGRSVPRKDAVDKVTGTARYAGDHIWAGALHLTQVFAGRPHARIRTISTERALSLPGIVAIFTAQDIPVNRYGLIVTDQPVLCDEVVRFEGDQVAAVVAETPEQASHAAKLIEVNYLDLPVLSDPEQAMIPGSPIIHEDRPGNIAHAIQLRRGNTGKALEKADVVFENEYRTPMQEHAFLELEAGLAHLDEQGRVVIHTAGQCVHDDQKQIAHALGIPSEQVRVVYGPVGGAFGGREDISVQIMLAFAAWKLGRSVRTSWNRGESIRGHSKRHAAIIRHRWGADREGLIVAAEIEVILDAGAYMCTSNSVLEGFHAHCIGPYEIPNVKLDGKAVFTNNIPGGAFRGYGAPQAAFAAELHISHIAELLGIDPVTIRQRNCLNDDSMLPTQSPLRGGTNLPRLLETCAAESGCVKKGEGWQMPSFEPVSGKRRGFGFAAGFKPTGYGYGFPEGSEARIVLIGERLIERAELYTAAVDVGQGSHSVLLQIASQVLGIPIERIEIFPSDTAIIGDAGAAAASRLTFFAGNAVKLAAKEALHAWVDECRPAIGEVRWESPPTTPPDPQTGACMDNLSYSFGVHGVEVEVDIKTGQVFLDKVVAVHDPGRAINPQQVEGQIEGAVVQSLGWALVEDFITRDAMVLTDKLSTYLIPTALDIPLELTSILIEKPDPTGPYGVRGIGEIPFIPLAPAIVSAIRDAIGVWFDHIPITPEEVLVQLINSTKDRHPKEN